MRSQRKITAGLIFSIICGSLLSCNDTADVFDFNAQLQKEIVEIDAYLAANSLTAIKDPSGVRMVITKLGTRLPAQLEHTVDVDYKGTLLTDGSTFDEGNVRVPLVGLISGWQIALTTLPEGSEATLFIPSYYGYGNVSQGKIPANSTLVFDVKFNDAAHSSAYLQRFGADTVLIDDYLVDKGITATKDTTGIRYVITAPGSGATPGWYDKLSLSYSIKLLTNDAQTIITLSPEISETFYSRSVDYVQGMMIGLHKLQVGGKATLYIPSGLGFGPGGGTHQGQLIIPANANLIVEVELKDIM